MLKVVFRSKARRDTLNLVSQGPLLAQ